MISIASAGFLTYYGKVEGIANVKGPTFYASPSKILSINEIPTSNATYIINDENALVFWTEENLGGIDFNYVPKADLYVRAKVNDTTYPRSLELIFGYSDTFGNTHKICSSIVNITSTDPINYHTSCTGSDTLSGVNKFYYKMQGKVDPTIEFGIIVGSSAGYTRIEVDKA